MDKLTREQIQSLSDTHLNRELLGQLKGEAFLNQSRWDFASSLDAQFELAEKFKMDYRTNILPIYRRSLSE